MNEWNGRLVVVLYIAVVNVITFVIYGIDKWKARNGRWRISEAVLLVLALVGGSLGAWAGMLAWRHKTRHRKFVYGVPLILAAQVALLFLVSCGTRHAVAVTHSAGSEQAREHSDSVFLVMYDPQVGKASLLEAIEHYNAEIVYDYSMMPGMAIKRPANKSLEETMQYFRTVKGVVSVDYDHIIRLTDPVRPRLERM